MNGSVRPFFVSIAILYCIAIYSPVHSFDHDEHHSPPQNRPETTTRPSLEQSTSSQHTSERPTTERPVTTTTSHPGHNLLPDLIHPDHNHTTTTTSPLDPLLPPGSGNDTSDPLQPLLPPGIHDPPSAGKPPFVPRWPRAVGTVRVLKGVRPGNEYPISVDLSKITIDNLRFALSPEFDAFVTLRFTCDS